MTLHVFCVCYMHDYVQGQPLPGLRLLIIFVYGFPSCVPFTCLACITVLMHDHPFHSFNDLCADVCVRACVRVCMCMCVYCPGQIRVRWWVWLPPFSSWSPALRGNILSYSLILRPLERKWGRQLSDLRLPFPPPSLPRLPQSSQHPVNAPHASSFSLCFHSVNNQAVALSVPGA